MTTTTFRPADGRLVGCRLVGVERLDSAAAQRVDDPARSTPSGHGAWRGGRGSSSRCAATSGASRAPPGARRSPRRRCSGGAVSIGSSGIVQTEHLFGREHSTGVRILGGRCDSSAVASVRRCWRWTRLPPMTGSCDAAAAEPCAADAARALADAPARARAAAWRGWSCCWSSGRSWPSSSAGRSTRTGRSGSVPPRSRRRSPQVEAENALLQQELDYLRSDAFVSAEARRLANLGAPGEQVLIIPPGAEAPLPEELSALEPPQPLLQQWLELFFGRRLGAGCRAVVTCMRRRLGVLECAIVARSSGAHLAIARLESAWGHLRLADLRRSRRLSATMARLAWARRSVASAMTARRRSAGSVARARRPPRCARRTAGGGAAASGRRCHRPRLRRPPSA